MLPGTPDATVVVDTRRTLRNGEFFETRLTATAARPLADVTVAFSPSVWRNMTVNTMLPAPRRPADQRRQGQRDRVI